MIEDTTLDELYDKAFDCIYDRLLYYNCIRDLDNQILDSIYEAISLGCSDFLEEIKPILIQVIPQEYI